MKLMNPMSPFNNILYCGLGLVGHNVLMLTCGQTIRDEVSAWVTMLGSVAITTATISIQVYHLIRDRDKDLKRNKKKNKKKGRKKK